MAVLTPDQLLARLARRFDALVGRQRDLPERHKSLSAALETTHRMLPGDVRQFFARLSVFRGSFTLETAEKVCEEPFALESLQVLRERSLILVEEHDTDIRYRLLETVAEFAGRQLGAPELRYLQRCHAEAYLDLARRMPRAAGSDAMLAQAFDAEQENFRAALGWCSEHEGRASMLADLCCELEPLWTRLGQWEEMRRWVERTVEMREHLSEPVWLRLSGIRRPLTANN
jgi:predicted ATPase